MTHCPTLAKRVSLSTRFVRRAAGGVVGGDEAGLRGRQEGSVKEKDLQRIQKGTAIKIIEEESVVDEDI